jgi:hypothetical protein
MFKSLREILQCTRDGGWCWQSRGTAFDQEAGMSAFQDWSLCEDDVFLPRMINVPYHTYHHYAEDCSDIFDTVSVAQGNDDFSSVVGIVLPDDDDEQFTEERRKKLQAVTFLQALRKPSGPEHSDDDEDDGLDSLQGVRLIDEDVSTAPKPNPKPRRRDVRPSKPPCRPMYVSDNEDDGYDSVLGVLLLDEGADDEPSKRVKKPTKSMRSTHRALPRALLPPVLVSKTVYESQRDLSKESLLHQSEPRSHSWSTSSTQASSPLPPPTTRMPNLFHRAQEKTPLRSNQSSLRSRTSSLAYSADNDNEDDDADEAEFNQIFQSDSMTLTDETWLLDSAALPALKSSFTVCGGLLHHNAMVCGGPSDFLAGSNSYDRDDNDDDSSYSSRGGYRWSPAARHHLLTDGKTPMRNTRHKKTTSYGTLETASSTTSCNSV